MRKKQEPVDYSSAVSFTKCDLDWLKARLDTSTQTERVLTLKVKVMAAYRDLAEQKRFDRVVSRIVSASEIVPAISVHKKDDPILDRLLRRAQKGLQSMKSGGTINAK